jgi:uncharacterized protein (DUF433 family)
VLRQARAERIAKAVKAALDKDFAEFPEDDRQAAPPLDGGGGGMSLGYISLAPLVTAHPHVMSGTPCVIGRRIPTATVAGNFSAGTPLAEIAKDYRLQMPEAEAALRYEFNRIAKRKPRFRATQTPGGNTE